MSVSVRDADLARDRASLERFIVGSNAYEAQFEPDRRLDPAVGTEYFTELADRVAKAQGRILVAEADGAIVGWAVCYVSHHEIFVKPEERRFGYISELFVEEAARGQHVGRTLLQACEDHFRALQIKSVLIGALAANVRAQNAYRAAGYSDYDINLRKLL